MLTREKRVLIVGGSVSAFDALHDIRFTAKLPLISSTREENALFGAAPFEHPDFDRRPAISRFDVDTGRVTFTDGSTVDDVDSILFATGYDFHFPFLPEIQPKNQRIPGLYQHVFHRDDPTLAFVGMVRMKTMSLSKLSRLIPWEGN
jgi:cation diffusion facilitator CzcD-associated flavoprotein CzcO